MNLEVSRNIFERHYKIRAVGAEFFHVERQADRQTGRQDMVKLIVAFHNFANALKSCFKVGSKK